MKIGDLRESDKPTRCAYCHAPAGATPVTCEGCGTQLHAECMAALKVCPTLGCGRLPVLKPPRRRGWKALVVGLILMTGAGAIFLLLLETPAEVAPLGPVRVASQRPLDVRPHVETDLLERVKSRYSKIKDLSCRFTDTYVGFPKGDEVYWSGTIEFKRPTLLIMHFKDRMGEGVNGYDGKRSWEHRRGQQLELLESTYYFDGAEPFLIPLLKGESRLVALQDVAPIETGTAARRLVEIPCRPGGWPVFVRVDPVSLDVTGFRASVEDPWDLNDLSVTEFTDLRIDVGLDDAVFAIPQPLEWPPK